MAVHLGGREGRVAEQLLDGAEVGAAFEQMCGEGVAKPVRVRDEPAQCGGVERTTVGREKDVGIRALRELWSPILQVDAQAVGGLFAELDGALLAALSADEEGLLLEVDGGQGE